MEVTARRSGPQHGVKMPTRWPDYLAWTLYMLALVQMALHFTITDLTSPNAIAIYSLYPLGTLGSAILLLFTTWRHPPGARRPAWGLFAGSFLLSSKEQTMLVTLVFETANVAVRGDPTAMRRVLDNLLSNAVKATAASRSGGNIELAIRSDADPP